MHKFVRSLITEWRKLGLPFDDETVIVAVSGGADSMSLMLALHELRTRKKILNRMIGVEVGRRERFQLEGDVQGLVLGEGIVEGPEHG